MSRELNLASRCNRVLIFLSLLFVADAFDFGSFLGGVLLIRFLFCFEGGISTSVLIMSTATGSLGSLINYSK